MSIWTHAAGIVVFNHFYDEELIHHLDDIFGKEWHYRSPRYVKEEAMHELSAFYTIWNGGKFKKDYLNGS